MHQTHHHHHYEQVIDTCEFDKTAAENNNEQQQQQHHHQGLIRMLFRSIITLANSIIGVSILAMPFCFKQCGIVLATLMLILSGVMVKVTCHLLLKSAILSRRRNYELLAFQTFGSAGKLAVEVIN